jgi:hypothetical protein
MFGFRFHNCDDPWEDAPPWAVELREMLRVVIYKENLNMTGQDDIASALAKVQSDVAVQTTVAASFQTYVQGLTAQISKLASQTPDTTTADALKTLASQIEANTATASSAIVQNTPAAGPTGGAGTDPNAPAAGGTPATGTTTTG